MWESTFWEFSQEMAECTLLKSDAFRLFPIYLQAVGFLEPCKKSFVLLSVPSNLNRVDSMLVKLPQ